jgi:hypothetical protein
VLSVRELREHERVQLEEVCRAGSLTQPGEPRHDSYQGMASAMPNGNQTSTALAAEVNKSPEVRVDVLVVERRGTADAVLLRFFMEV